MNQTPTRASQSEGVELLRSLLTATEQDIAKEEAKAASEARAAAVRMAELIIRRDQIAKLAQMAGAA